MRAAESPTNGPTPRGGEIGSDLMFPRLSQTVVPVLDVGQRWAAVYNSAGMVTDEPQDDLLPSEAARLEEPELPLMERLKNTFGKECYIVTRRDRRTSGIFLVAFDPETAKALEEAIEDTESSNTYFALCHGDASHRMGRGPFTIDNEIRDDNPRNASSTYEWGPAKTDFEVLYGGVHPDCWLVSAQPKKRGYHQIRRHLRDINLPIIGDKSVAAEVSAYWESCLTVVPRRLLLHLHRVELPATRRTPPLTVACPLPPDFAGLIRSSCPGWAPAAQAALPTLFAPPPTPMRVSATRPPQPDAATPAQTASSGRWPWKRPRSGGAAPEQKGGGPPLIKLIKRLRGGKGRSGGEEGEEED